MRALISLGSNLGERAALLADAVDRLGGLAASGSVRVSHLYETRPWGLADQPDFLNAVVAFETTLEAGTVLEVCKRIERDLGRVESVRWGPRKIDLDLLDLEGRVVEGAALSLPHPRIAERAFVLVPLCELRPDWTDPRTGTSAAEMLAALDPDPDEVRLVGRLSDTGGDRCRRNTIRLS